MKSTKFCFMGRLTSVLLILTNLSYFNSGLSQHFSYPKSNPVELGKVKWLRDYDLALKQSKIKKLPVLILFQEVPGCSNCTNFGNKILSNPLIVEAIESFFIPLCIYNNTEGRDRKILNKFNEPTWNNPVIRIINNDGNDIIPRQADFIKMSATLSGIKEGILKSGQTVPRYLELLAEEVNAAESGQISEVFFSMYCFWSGEKEIAGINGVIATEAGYMNGHEVVRIQYRRDKISLTNLFARSKKAGCGDEIYGSVSTEPNIKIKPAGKFRKDKEDKYYLYNSEYNVIPMTELQKTKINRLLAVGQKPHLLLSPKQLSLLKDKNYSASHISDKIEDVWW